MDDKQNKISDIKRKKTPASLSPDFSAPDKESIRTMAKRPAKKKKPKAKKIIAFLAIFLITALVVFSNQVYVSEDQSTSWFANLPIVKQIRHLAESADRRLKGEVDDRINVLLLGMGGRRHEGGYLTDTIMVASFEPSSGKVALISIPRDLAIPVEDMGWQKINSINAYAEMETEGSGGLAISQAVSDILEIPIDYYLRVDFEGFVNVVDELGGLRVNVENTIDDYRYPVPGREAAEDYESRYEHLHIDEGWQEMDGELALKYARSRHSLGAEGSDFARARRQQKILIATKDKIISADLLLQPKKIAAIINELQDHISTNLKIWEMIKFYELFHESGRDKIFTRVLDNGPNGLLVDSFTEEGAYILVPRSGDFTEIQYFVMNVFSDAPPEKKTQVARESATIEVRNGTWINGLAAQTALDLEKYGFIVVRIGNSSRQNFRHSMIYDLTYGEKSQSLNVLKNHTQADVSYSLPDWLIQDIQGELDNTSPASQPDFILILGQDADKSGSGTINPENGPDDSLE